MLPSNRPAPPFGRLLRPVLVSLLVWATGCAPTTPEELAPDRISASGQVPRNVIFFVVDGMGFNYLDAAALYRGGEPRYQVEGEAGDLRRPNPSAPPNWSFEAFPVRLAMSTHTAVGSYDPDQAWSSFEAVIGTEYEPTTVTGSAASATSLSSGVKTIDPAVGLDADGRPVRHLAHLAVELGKAVGIVTNVPINHATPAGFIAHDSSRTNYRAISDQMILESPAAVIMGTGHPWFDDDGQRLDAPRHFWISQDTWTAAVEGRTGFTLIDDAEAFRALAEGPTPSRVLGIARAFNATQFNRDPNPLSRSHREGPPGVVDPDEPPFAAPFNPSVPTLAEMTLGALNVLANASDQGLFLVVEGGAADWGGHWNLLGRTIEEMIFLDEAVSAVIDWVERESSWNETLVVVTSDHETGHLSGPGSNPGWRALEDRGPGRMPGHAWHHIYHTNQLVPFFARGAGAERYAGMTAGRLDPVRGPYIDNTDVPRLVFELWDP